ESALAFAASVLRPGGAFIVKTFRGEGWDAFVRALKDHFEEVRTAKPQASRKESAEVYLVAKNRKG
ncbi:MAG: RlmE family RNA methyltransferase, partial [Zetaproteobacteria bacterium]